ncbi:SagB family peptide dehydrogenase [Streptomyces sp. NBC_01500]|uniref:SagB family peptide dehydrogenase n=1 Tax=Streptomyces sp. NBC_01500 TaxID=2903886 RepID=UPI002258AF05|nr:SagB family peptide dehydrogenase [Streptomyces sp. NBC_01500]MCX4553329.1 SagB family peptide dehydrogenase [Streptomyces sp. NBC_01500]
MGEPASGAAGSVGLRFWWRTFEGVQELFAEGHGEEGGPDDPLPTKTYRGLPRHVLSEPSRRIGDARSSFAGFRRTRSEDGPNREVLDGTALSALLHHSYGLERMELGPHAAWPYHRAVASARCFYPVELYLWLARPAENRPAGCYHYDPAHHALTRLRTGGVPDELRTATGTGRDGTLALMVAAVCFRKTAFRYRDYAYRLCAQEVGLTVGNMLLVAGALGLRGRVHHRFDDAVVNRALGLDGDEETAFAVLDLFPWQPAGTGQAPLRAEPEEPQPVIRPHQLRTDAADPAAWSGLTALNRAARLTGTGWNTPVDQAAFHLPPDGPGPTPVPLGEPSPGQVELAEAIRARDSGGRMFLPDSAALPLPQLGSLLRHALEPVPSDHAETPCRPLADCHVLVLNAAGADAGLYRLDTTPALTALPGRDWRAVLAMLCDRTPAVNSAKAHAIVFLSVNRAEGDRWFGDRGYRILHHEAGIVAQRISVLAAATGLSARVTNGYHEGMVRSLIGADEAHVPVFTLVLGRRRDSAQYEPPLTW